MAYTTNNQYNPYYITTLRAKRSELDSWYPGGMVGWVVQESRERFLEKTLVFMMLL